MSSCTTVRNAPYDVAFFDSPEAAALVAATTHPTELAGVVAVRFRMFLWPSHITNLLHARYGVGVAQVSIGTLGRLLFEDLRALRNTDPNLPDELLEELVAFYGYLARVRPDSNAPRVLSWLARPATARRLRRALLR